jgi:hypothetical protein
MGVLRKIVGTMFKKKATAPGKSVVAQVSSSGEVTRTVELYHPPGIVSTPTPDDIAVEVSTGRTGRAIIASKNYRIEIEPASGELILFSTNENGSTEQAKIHLKNDGAIQITSNGNIEINGNSKSLVTHAELDAALQMYVGLVNVLFASKIDGGGAAGTLSLNIASAATTTVKTGG